MNVDQHPEELIDRARHGALDVAEHSALERHLATCEACAALLAQEAQVERELAAQSRDEMLNQHAVEAAMLRMQRALPAGPAGRSRVWPRWLRLAAAGVLLTSGVTATAAILRRTFSARPPVETPVPPAVERSAARPAPPPIELPEPIEEPAPPVVPPRSAPPKRVVTAAALFEHAEKLRREGRGEAAVAGYRRLQEAFPDARESRLSFVLAGQLLLARGRPNDALVQFDRHPGIGGDVGEEALAGRAAALEQLHRTADAIVAWKTLLERYPKSIYAARARARLSALVEPR